MDSNNYLQQSATLTNELHFLCGAEYLDGHWTPQSILSFP